MKPGWSELTTALRRSVIDVFMNPRLDGCWPGSLNVAMAPHNRYRRRMAIQASRHWRWY